MQPPLTVLPPLQVRLQQPRHQLSLLQQINGGSNLSLPPPKCPMARTFYRCPAPGEPPFVKVGDKVQKGQVVCIIEAMKLMSEIEVQGDKPGSKYPAVT